MAGDRYRLRRIAGLCGGCGKVRTRESRCADCIQRGNGGMARSIDVEKARAAALAANPVRHLSPDEYEAERRRPVKVGGDKPTAPALPRPSSNVRCW